jgi:hypothetical protein
MQKLLQEELHNTSQFAIQLSCKYEAKRKERDQVIQQLQGQQRYGSNQLQHYGLHQTFCTCLGGRPVVLSCCYLLLGYV